MSQRLKEVVEELKRRKSLVKTCDFTDPIFEIQNRLILDEYRFHAWNATRRAAKSVTFAKRCLRKMSLNKGSRCLYGALTLGSAVGILWDVVTGELDKSGLQYRESRDSKSQSIILANGSFLRFVGVDANYKEMKKILGQSYDVVGLDECGSMTQDMEMLVNQMIKPALIDRDGDLILLGTCENIPDTYFQKVVEGRMDNYFKVTRWDTYENPYMATKWKVEIDSILNQNPDSAKTSWFRTHYLNEWCADDDLLIISGKPVYYDELPEGEKLYCLGVDLGFNDANAFTLYCMVIGHPGLFMEFSYKCPELDFTGVANEIKKIMSDYPCFKVMIDGANKQGVEEMRNRHGLSILTAAEKTDKATFLRMFNDDYLQKRIYHRRGKCSNIEAEQSKLMWIKGTDKEDPRCENHCNDSALYGWREMKQYLTREDEPCKTIDEKMEMMFKTEAEEAMKEMEELSYSY